MKPTDHGAHKRRAARAPTSPSRRGPSDEMHNDDVGHEHSDINIGAILMSGVVVFVVCSVTAGLMYGLFWLLEKQAATRDPQLSPVALPATAMPATTQPTAEFGAAPSPRLLTDEPTNLEHVRERERAGLHGYGWVDQGAGRRAHFDRPGQAPDRRARAAGARRRGDGHAARHARAGVRRGVVRPCDHQADHARTRRPWFRGAAGAEATHKPH